MQKNKQSGQNDLLAPKIIAQSMLDCQQIPFEKQSRLLNVQVLTQYSNKYQKCIEAIKRICQNFGTDSYAQVQQLFVEDHQSRLPFFQSWKIIMKAMFDLISQQISQTCQDSGKIIQKQKNKLYNQSALYALSALSLKPKLLANAQFSTVNRYENLFQISRLSQACSFILMQISLRTQKQQLSSEIKRLMAQNFDKVGIQVIRQIIFKNLFLSKCLLMTNHINKCKILIEQIIRIYDLSNSSKTQIINFLQNLFPGIPSEVVIDYCREISSRDKYLLRYTLYEKQLTIYDDILQKDLYDLATKKKQK